MSALYETMMVPCTRMEKRRVPDGAGGWDWQWTDGEQFNAVVHKDSTMQARIAEKQGVTELYTITTDRNHPLEFHDVFRRNSDGLILRVTSNAVDNQSPVFSGIDISQVTAEVWNLQ